MTKYRNDMRFHMLMFMNAWMMLVLMKCRCKMQCLTPGCYKASLETFYFLLLCVDKLWGISRKIVEGIHALSKGFGPLSKPHVLGGFLMH